MKATSLLFTAGLALLLVGAGCSSPPTTALEAQAASEAVALSAGSSLIIKQTVFGLGGVFAETVAGNNLAEYQVSIYSFSPADLVAFTWTSTSEQETEASLTARMTYEATNHPIGDSSTAPTPVYETVTKTGSFDSTALNNAVNVLLPAYWAEGEQSFEDNSIIWLSKQQYDGLVNTKTATLSLGLFDEKISSLLEMSDKVQGALNALQQKAETASQSEDIYKLTAKDSWQTYSLTIDGKEQTVQTIEASNWFGSYVILANPENPLILKATLNPFALGSFDLSSPLSSFLGYEVTEIKTK
ncbi:MAG: hypothetical protein WC702_00950 [Patescibacteria group bacterium]|jgi:hypothetical protein